ncbi:pyridoxal-phosphate dependent enzyme [Ochrobactrum teleogrylli]|uniref:Pyridoxal-phosphate dependent enzyme n=1 Tax=Ochrobactrum soli TaxID=2448455 RepID=A0A849KX35_9HYPH|nr:pyridoxal-phosphate dependent enzyme [[Ochrobactrum] soli]NNU63108.1 pyridoxal-phosphate dependent enzyme [[Ochrobactrum] soli]
MIDKIAAYCCYRCGGEFPINLPIDSRGCPACVQTAPSNLRVLYRPPSPAKLTHKGKSGLPSLWRYCEKLPFDERRAVSLGEGLTPLLRSERIGAAIGTPNFFIKNEGYNPTWSHKDRFSTVAVTAAVEAGASVVATSSSGNAGASLAAYAARAGLECVVATIAGSAGPMLSQIQKYGAKIVPFENKQDRWPFLAEGVERYGWFATSPYRHPVVGSHPIGIEGYKTLAYEIIEQFHGKVPDWCAFPVCYGDALAGAWLGFRELMTCGMISRMPRLLAAEAHGSLAKALETEVDQIPDMPASFNALAISVGATRSTYQALNALRASKGIAVPVSNEGLVTLQEQIAATEGIFLELSSVMSVAAIATARRQNVIRGDESVVAIVTASGLKDIDKSASGKILPRFDNIDDALRHCDI